MDLLVAYGCTENSPATFYVDRAANEEQKTQTIGKALAHTEGKLIDADGKQSAGERSGKFVFEDILYSKVQIRKYSYSNELKYK